VKPRVQSDEGVRFNVCERGETKAMLALRTSFRQVKDDSSRNQVTYTCVSMFELRPMVNSGLLPQVGIVAGLRAAGAACNSFTTGSLASQVMRLQC
jgi:hypothetical protein